MIHNGNLTNTDQLRQLLNSSTSFFNRHMRTDSDSEVRGWPSLGGPAAGGLRRSSRGQACCCTASAASPLVASCMPDLCISLPLPPPSPQVLLNVLADEIHRAHQRCLLEDECDPNRVRSTVGCSSFF